jgi:hypothetical protein
MKNDILKFDHIIIGVTVGIIFPIIIMHFWLQQYLNLSLIDVIRNPYFSEIVNILKGSLFVNLAIFFGFYWFRKDKSARGVVLATILYGAFYVYYMFFM